MKELLETKKISSLLILSSLTLIYYLNLIKLPNYYNSNENISIHNTCVKIFESYYDYSNSVLLFIVIIIIGIFLGVFSNDLEIKYYYNKIISYFKKNKLSS